MSAESWFVEIDPRCRCYVRVDLERPIPADIDGNAPLWVIGYLCGCPVEAHRPDRLLIYGVPLVRPALQIAGDLEQASRLYSAGQSS